MALATDALLAQLIASIDDEPAIGRTRAFRDAATRAAAALLERPSDPAVLLALRRTHHETKLALDAAVLATAPADAALLDAASRVLAAVECLAGGDVDEARAYAGASLAPLAECRVLGGRATSFESSLASLKDELRARIRRSDR